MVVFTQRKGHGQSCLRMARPGRTSSGRLQAGVILPIILLTAVVFGQWLETTVKLPEAGGPLMPEAIVITRDKVYIGGSDGTGLLVLDATMMGVTALLPELVGARPLAWVPTANKVYASRSGR